MDILEKLAVKHPYYCSDSNYYSREASETYETMTEFLDEFEDADEDMNYVFRWDIRPRGEGKESKKAQRYRAEIFMILQRKGIFKPIEVKHVNEQEAERFKAYLHKHWDLTKKLWEPIT